MLLALGAVGCSFQMRGPDEYRQVTAELLETRRAAVEACHADTLKTNPNATGTVVVHFFVAEETGRISDVEVLPETTAAPALAECVVSNLEGLSLAPPDQRKGDATFAYRFQ